jgi:hypothetical protein
VDGETSDGKRTEEKLSYMKGIGKLVCGKLIELED